MYLDSRVVLGRSVRKTRCRYSKQSRRTRGNKSFIKKSWQA